MTNPEFTGVFVSIADYALRAHTHTHIIYGAAEHAPQRSVSDAMHILRTPLRIIRRGAQTPRCACGFCSLCSD